MSWLFYIAEGLVVFKDVATNFYSLTYEPS